jgi:hypothetical protein
MILDLMYAETISSLSYETLRPTVNRKRWVDLVYEYSKRHLRA